MNADPRLLLLTFFYPPYNPTEGRRSFRISQAAINAGWNVDVIAPWAPHYHSGGIDHDWVDHISDHSRLTVHRIPQGVYDIAPLFSKTINWFLDHTRPGKIVQPYLRFPDRCISWINFLLPKAIKLVLSEKPSIIITSSYPYTTHIAGLILSWIFHLPWIIDTRDGWAVDQDEQFSQIVPAQKLHSAHRQLMSVVYKRANQVWSLTPEICKATRELFPYESKDKFVPIVQGFSAPKFNVPECQGAKRSCDHQGQKFIIGYAGRFRPRLTPAEPIVMGLKALKQSNLSLYEKVILRTWGNTDPVSAQYLYELMSFHSVTDRLEQRDPIPETHLVRELRDCDLLLVTNGTSAWSQKRLTTKIFVYLSAQKPILAICMPGSSIDSFVCEAHIGFSIPPDNPGMISRGLERVILEKLENGMLDYHPNESVLGAYSLEKGVFPLIVENIRRCASIH